MIMTPYKYTIGIDVSKKNISVCIKDHMKNTIAQTSFTQDYQGLLSLVELLDKTVDRNSSMVGVESTSIYHLPVYYFLNNHKFRTVVINPYLIEKFSKLNLRPTKTDKKDASTIADFLHHFSPTPTPFDKAPVELKILAREREKLSRGIAQLKNEIQRILSLLFPELKRDQILTVNMLKFLRIFPSAYAIRRADREVLTAVFSRIFGCRRGRTNQITLDVLFDMAGRSIGISSPTLESILKAKVNGLLTAIYEMGIFDRRFLEAARGIYKSEMEILTSIPGVGSVLAAYFLAEVEDVRRFGSAKKLVAYAGIDAIIKQSGRSEVRWGISKRGNKHLRRVVYIIALNLVRNCEGFREYYEGLKARRKRPKVALIGVANKFLRCAYAMLLRKTPYLPN
jgi:transposase